MPQFRGRVLVVDDAVSVADGLRELLSRYLYYVHVAHSCEEAVEELATDRFDVIVVDWVLPDGGGREVIELVRVMAPDAAIVVHSAYPTSDAECAASAHQFVEKGASTEPIRNAIERGLSEARRRRTDAARLAWSTHEDDSWFVIPLLRELKFTGDLVGPMGFLAAPGGVPESLVGWLGGSGGQPGTFFEIDCERLGGGEFDESVFGRVIRASSGTVNVKRGAAETVADGILYVRNVQSLDADRQRKLATAVKTATINRTGVAREIPVNFRLVVSVEVDQFPDGVPETVGSELRGVIGSNWITIPQVADLTDNGRLLVGRALETIDRDRQWLTPSARWAIENMPLGYSLAEVPDALRRVRDRARSSPVEAENLGFPFLEACFEERLRRDQRFPAWSAIRESIERFYLCRVLSESRGNVTRAAELSELGRQAMHRRLRKLGIKPALFRGATDQPLFDGASSMGQPPPSS